MVASTIAKPQLNCNLLLLAHLVCADEQIHIQEAKALQSLTEQISADQTTKDALEAILSKAPTAPTVEALAQKILPGQQIESLKQLLAVACIDGYLAPVEETFVTNVAKLWNISEEEVKHLRLSAKQARRSQFSLKADKDDLSRGAHILKGTESVLSRALIKRLADIAPESLGRRVHKLQQEILLAGPEYDKAIEICAKVAQKDYRFADSGLSSASKTLKDLREQMQSVINQLGSQVAKAGSGKTLGDVVAQLEATRQELDERTLKELEDIQLALKAKQRSLNHFTIAFMGRTKAGKSTLHATVTGEGWEAIGVGMQRTTRYNRVYEWKNIRIIDTPGIGAPGGEDDEAIAGSIVDESDVICYVVTDDSIQETEFEFMKVLKERTKPLIVLLNVKKNLQDSRRLEHFLKNPDKLFIKGDNGIDGHIERIKRYTKEHYANGYLDIVPVMLLAAQLSRKSEDKKQAAKLLQASRLKDFLDSLRMAIVEYGPIRRSQTLLGSTVYSVEQPQKWAEVQTKKYYEIAEDISNKRIRIKKESETALIDVKETLNQNIKVIFADLNKSLDVFCNAHWKDSEKDIQKAWKARLEERKLNQRIEIAFKDAQAELEKRMRETIEEIGTELKLLADFRMDSAKFMKAQKNSFVSGQDLLKLSGAVLGCLFAFSTGGIGPLLFSAGMAIVGLFADNLKSERSRKDKAASLIRAELVKHLNNCEKRALAQAQQQIEKCSGIMVITINQYFEQLSNGLAQMSEYLHSTETSLRDIAMSLNKAYANRIMQWATGKEQKVDRVQRIFGRQIEIWQTQPNSTKKVPLRKSVEELSQILQEKIIIH